MRKSKFQWVLVFAIVALLVLVIVQIYWVNNTFRLRKDRIKGLRLGADDYITKPFNMEELELRIRAILKRGNKPGGKRSKPVSITFGAFHYEGHLRELKYKGKIVRRLSKKEGDLLALLLGNINRIIDRDFVLHELWELNDYYTSRSMDVYIARLRKYLAPDPSIRIVNLHGTGFMLEIQDQKA